MIGEPEDEALERALSADDEEVRLAAVMRLAGGGATALSERALAALVGCLGAQRKALGRRAAGALAAAAARGDARVVEAVRQALSSPKAQTRWGAAYALGLIGGPLDASALNALLEALSGPDSDVRWAAAELVARLGRGDQARVRPLLLSLGREGGGAGRRMALYCLRDMGARGEDILELAEQCAHAPDALVRLAALSLISHCGGEGERATAIALERLESDPEPAVRRSAALALGRIGNRSPQVLRALRRSAAEPRDRFLSRAAEVALRWLQQE